MSQKKIVEFILENGKITNKDVQQLLGVKDSRALKVLKGLVEMDVVVKQGKLKGSYYTIKDFEWEGERSNVRRNIFATQH